MFISAFLVDLLKILFFLFINVFGVLTENSIFFKLIPKLSNKFIIGIRFVLSILAYIAPSLYHVS